MYVPDNVTGGVREGVLYNDPCCPMTCPCTEDVCRPVSAGALVCLKDCGLEDVGCTGSDIDALPALGKGTRLQLPRLGN